LLISSVNIIYPLLGGVTTSYKNNKNNLHIMMLMTKLQLMIDI